ncbi:hypothetical protein RJ640_019420, partial [Escallonia rubra]
MTIDRTYPIFTVRWLAVHGLAVPTVSFLGSSNDKPNPNYRATTQSNPNEQNVELNRTSLYWGLLLIFHDTTGRIPLWIIGTVTGIVVIGLI